MLIYWRVTHYWPLISEQKLEGNSFSYRVSSHVDGEFPCVWCLPSGYLTVYLLKMVICHGKLLNNQRVNPSLWCLNPIASSMMAKFQSWFCCWSTGGEHLRFRCASGDWSPINSPSPRVSGDLCLVAGGTWWDPQQRGFLHRAMGSSTWTHSSCMFAAWTGVI